MDKASSSEITASAQNTNIMKNITFHPNHNLPYVTDKVNVDHCSWDAATLQTAMRTENLIS